MEESHLVPKVICNFDKPSGNGIPVMNPAVTANQISPASPFDYAVVPNGFWRNTDHFRQSTSKDEQDYQGPCTHKGFQGQSTPLPPRLLQTQHRYFTQGGVSAEREHLHQEPCED